jgi:hypothetical protein
MSQQGQSQAKDWKSVETRQINNLEELRQFIGRLNSVAQSTTQPSEVFIYNEQGKSPTFTLRHSETGGSGGHAVYDCMIT